MSTILTKLQIIIATWSYWTLQQKNCKNVNKQRWTYTNNTIRNPLLLLSHEPIMQQNECDTYSNLVKSTNNATQIYYYPQSLRAQMISSTLYTTTNSKNSSTDPWLQINTRTDKLNLIQWEWNDRQCSQNKNSDPRVQLQQYVEMNERCGTKEIPKRGSWFVWNKFKSTKLKNESFASELLKESSNLGNSSFTV